MVGGKVIFTTVLSCEVIVDIMARHKEMFVTVVEYKVMRFSFLSIILKSNDMSWIQCIPESMTDTDSD